MSAPVALNRRPKLLLVAATACVALIAAVLGARLANSREERQVPALPLIGANFSHFAEHGCATGQNGLLGTGIVANWERPGVDALVRQQLKKMAAAGLRSLRLIVWHQTDVAGANWGVISSRGGKPSLSNEKGLAGYLGAVRDAGFTRLTVSLAPMGTNDPASSRYKPPKLDENWAFLRRVRSLARRYGPASIHIDLMNEGTPNPYDQAAVTRVRGYLAELYRRYVTAYGNRDVTVSAIATQRPPDTRSRLQNLIDALRASGKPLPRWFDVHVGYHGQSSIQNLRAIEAVLVHNHLRAPLVLGEVPYEDPATARAIARYQRTVSRSVLEVMEWPLTPDRPCRGISVPPPYRASAYLRVLLP